MQKTAETKSFSEMSHEELKALIAAEQKKLDHWSDMDLTLDLTRGKPNQAQLDLSSGMLSIISNRGDCFSASGLDCRNYGILDGLPETKKLFSDLLDIPTKNILVLGNSSLNVMYDTIVRAMLFGVAGGHEPWCRQGRIKFICPSPGYDRHFTICREMGIEMVPVKMNDDGPDMNEVYNIACSDPSVKGMWCVPKFSNPEGITYSDEVVEQIAMMKPAAPDFRIFWDNAYCVHHLYEEKQDEIPEILSECAKAGNPDMVYEFCSTSKISFPGSGISCIATSENNIKDIKKQMTVQTIGHDKINQLRHVRFFKNSNGIKEHMKKHAAILRPKFEAVLDILDRELGGLEIGTWVRPNGGYFISFDAMEGCAKAIVARCKEAGVVMTGAGATYPYHKDPKDSNIRIAPSFPTTEDLAAAADLFVLCVKLVSVEKLLETK